MCVNLWRAGGIPHACDDTDPAALSAIAKCGRLCSRAHTAVSHRRHVDPAHLRIIQNRRERDDDPALAVGDRGEGLHDRLVARAGGLEGVEVGECGCAVDGHVELPLAWGVPEDLREVQANGVGLAGGEAGEGVAEVAEAFGDRTNP